MIDYARINVKAGDGGVGAGSFRNIKGKRYGRADGGDGGRGGDVYIEATDDLNTLEPYRFVKDYRAFNGKPGASNLRKGADGEDLVLKVPVGTTVRISGPVTSFLPVSARSGGQSAEVKGHSLSEANDTSLNDNVSLRAVGNPSTGATQNSTIYDLIEPGQRVLIARDGEGGRGNAKLRDEFGRRPRSGESGEAGESRQVTLELKLLADVGLIGLPNSGKSTLLAALTAARPAIAAYPFTTLEPNLGVLTFSGPVTSFLPVSARSRDTADHDQKSFGELRAVGNPSSGATQKSSLVIADIPGLIEGASRGRGLGDLFLKHIERTKILVHLIDASTKSDKWQDYQTVRSELRQYSKDLVKKKEIIVLTKTDLVDLPVVEAAIAVFAKHRKKVMAISVKMGIGLERLVQMLFKVTKSIR